MKVLIVPSNVDEVGTAAHYLASRLVISGIDALVQDSKAPDQLSVPVDELALVVCMGGDGTFLRAARLVDFAPVPMLALNYGTLSFLSGNPARDDVELVTNALAGDMVFEHRSTADITIEQADGQVINATALNEIAYTRGRSGRVVEYRYGINGITIAQLKADGLVVATPTGSTATRSRLVAPSCLRPIRVLSSCRLRPMRSTPVPLCSHLRMCSRSSWIRRVRAMRRCS